MSSKNINNHAPPSLVFQNSISVSDSKNSPPPAILSVRQSRDKAPPTSQCVAKSSIASLPNYLNNSLKKNPFRSNINRSTMLEEENYKCKKNRKNVKNSSRISVTIDVTAKRRDLLPSQMVETTLPIAPAQNVLVTEVFDDMLTKDESELLPGNKSSCYGILNPEQDDEMIIAGYRRSIPRTALCWFGFFLTAGLLRLFMHWWRHWHLLATHTLCPLDIAQKLLIREDYQGKHTVYYVKDVITLNTNSLNKMRQEKEKWLTYFPLDERMDQMDELQLSVHFSGGIFKRMDTVRLFRCKQLRYAWDEQTYAFQKLKGLDVNVPTVYLHHSVRRGLSERERFTRQLVYGINQIAVPFKGVVTLLFLEVLNPFYVFQVFSVCLWISYNYYYYAAVIVLMSTFGITISIVQTRKNQEALRNTVQGSDQTLVVNDACEMNTVDTKLLVPGDLIEIPSTGCTMHCDAVLLSGNCILDESMLTGESVPVTKTPLPIKRDANFDTKEHARHTLFCGTKVIQTRYIGREKVYAVVINTGNCTAKGGLVRSILYPPPVDYKFENDSYKFIALLGLTAAMGFTYTLVTKIMRGVAGTKIAIESLDLITIAVPPALPAAMTVGRFNAQKRLERNGIYCISPRSINVSGSIDCVCFDKTGTLTEDGLDMWGVVPKSSTNHFQIPLQNVERLPCDHLLYGMLTCHSITIMNGELKGDPLDLKMFESTGWILEEANVADDNKYDMLYPTVVRQPKTNKSQSSQSDLQQQQQRNYNCGGSVDEIFSPNNDIGIVREFSFTSTLQRMSVITRRLEDNHYNVYCKGSPEMIKTLCRPDSIPDNYFTELDVYAQQGYRVIAIAYKALDRKVKYSRVQRLARDRIECDLEFQGFVVLENRLKPDTSEVIKNLTAANIRTIMVTGDNILTAISVAKDCEMIPAHQNVITVTARQSGDDPGSWTLDYSTAGGGHAGPPADAIIQNNELISTSLTDEVLTNSNSAASIATFETWTRMDIESGGCNSIVQLERFVAFNRAERDARKTTAMTKDYCFAMVGKTWSVLREHFSKELLAKFLTRGTIFARMSPDQKQSLILELQDLGYYVAMCGDGANDCGALKAAHTGISLSEAESSVASPFTSKNPTIACVPSVIKEGRTALVTSFGVFKYMAAYSLVQFSSVLILYTIDSNLTDLQFLYIDLFLISIFAFLFGKTESYRGSLVRETPLSSLISLSPIASLVLHLAVAIGMQLIGWYHLQQQPWFVPFNFTGDDTDDDASLACHENYTIFIISCFQYIILAIVFSKGAPYRRSIFSNYWFCLTLLLNTFIILYFALSPAEYLPTKFIGLDVPPDLGFRAALVAYGAVNFVLSIFIEYFVVEWLLFKKLRYRFHNVLKSRRKYLRVENQLQRETKWPPTLMGDGGDAANGADRNCAKLSSIMSTTANDCEEKSSPLSYAEIGAEEGDGAKILFAEQNSVLNSFFDQPERAYNDEGHRTPCPLNNSQDNDSYGDGGSSTESLSDYEEDCVVSNTKLNDFDGHEDDDGHYDTPKTGKKLLNGINNLRSALRENATIRNPNTEIPTTETTINEMVGRSSFAYCDTSELSSEKGKGKQNGSDRRRDAADAKNFLVNGTMSDKFETEKQQPEPYSNWNENDINETKMLPKKIDAFPANLEFPKNLRNESTDGPYKNVLKQENVNNMELNVITNKSMNKNSS